MSYFIYKRPKSSFWWACYGPQKTRRSTKVEINPKKHDDGSKPATARMAKQRATEIAAAWDAACHEGMTAKAVRKVLIEIASPEEESISVEEYARQWCNERRKHVTLRSIVRDSKAIEQFLEFLGPEGVKRPISSIRVHTAQQFVDFQIDRVSPGTVDRYRATLSVMFNAAYAAELIVRNPFRGVKIPKRQDDVNEREAFTPEEINRLVDELPAEWSSMVKCCIYLGGQRLGDMALLKWSDVDFENDTVTIVTQKTSRLMVIPLLKKLRAHLEGLERSSDYVHPCLSARVLRHGNTSSISTEFSGYMRLMGLANPIEKKEGDRRGLSNKSFHSLRASAVTMLYLAGVPLEIVLRIAGHSHKKISMLYLKLAQNQVRKEMEKIDQTLESARRGKTEG